MTTKLSKLQIDQVYLPAAVHLIDENYQRVATVHGDYDLMIGEAIVEACNSHQKIMRLLKESYSRFTHDEDEDLIPHSEVCYCTETDTGYGPLVCLPCELREALTCEVPEIIREYRKWENVNLNDDPSSLNGGDGPLLDGIRETDAGRKLNRQSQN